MKKKVLITGSNGLLGQKLVDLFCSEDDFEVVAFSRGENRNNSVNGYVYYNIDITNSKEVVQFINKEKPDYIINCAALTNVDSCELEKEKCDLINVEAVKTLVNYAEKNNIHLIHISTDFIFDGENGPYKEDDVPNPVNYYGLSKLKSETLITNADIRYTILRTILVYGMVDNMNNSNIVLFVKNALENDREITMVDDQYRMPTLVDDLAQACFSSVVDKRYGIFHVSSNELLSIYDMAFQIADVFNLNTSFIKRIPSSRLKQPAKRPPKTGFNLEKSQKTLNFPISSFKNRLQVFKNQLINNED